jgi:hypothetical protein
MKEDLLEKSKLAQNAYKNDYRVAWDEGRILEIERNSSIGDTRNWPIWRV